MPRQYAKNTSVSTSRSIEQIRSVLQKYGADQFMFGEDSNRAIIAFAMPDEGGTIQVRIILPMPDRNSEEFTQTPSGRERSDEVALREWEQACRERYRSLHLVVKAKLEAVSSGISTIEQEFLAWVALPNGQTVGEVVNEQKHQLRSSGSLLLPGSTR